MADKSDAEDETGLPQEGSDAPVPHQGLPSEAELLVSPSAAGASGRDQALEPAGPPPVLPPYAPDISSAEADFGSRFMSFRPHLEELRDRLIKSVIALVIAIAVSFTFTGAIFDVLKSRAEGITLIRTGVAEMIGTYMKVAVISGVVLATPVWLYHLVAFIAPGLTPKEKRYLFAALPGVIASFILGVLFGYFVLLPPALNFLIHFGEDIAVPLIRVGDYVSTVTSLLFWIGLCFETPLVIYVLARLGIVTPQRLTQYRRHAVVGAFVLGALITPTFDPINQTLVAVPLILLYELGILLARVAARARESS